MSEEADIGEAEENLDAIDKVLSSEFLTNSALDSDLLLEGTSYSYYSDVPASLLRTPNETVREKLTLSACDQPGESHTACMLGVDEAGRGPVLGPMVYGVFYLPLTLSDSLLREKHQFDDSKVLTKIARTNLMREICKEGSELCTYCGWAVEVMSARDIGSNMLKPCVSYNLNAQAMDATIGLIKGVFDRGVNVKEIYIDTIGKPETYQKKLEHIFPTARITVAKKADSLYSCVSAASICAKVTRDAALQLIFQKHLKQKELDRNDTTDEIEENSWGSGYPSDAKCMKWLKKNIHPLFGWGNECRFSWGTAKDMLDQKDLAFKVEWCDNGDKTSRMTQYFSFENEQNTDELCTWFGKPVDTTLI